jgi:catechol 2,3-dioxygenase-like lactoylglutathione lyase family enzyme
VTSVIRLDRIQLVCRDVDGLAAFYVEALGFRDIADGSARRLATRRLQLGDSRLELVQSAAGRPYPGDLPGWDLRFQHFALAIPDMTAAVERLGRTSGWRSISNGGPQQLPATSGGVAAFKFRDPEGHPLEFLRLPPDPLNTVARIDHSAISVSDTGSSLAFYETLGLRRSRGSLNEGPEQDRLDGLNNVTVEVTALTTAAEAPPHLELLSYWVASRPPVPPAEPDEVAATRLVFTVASARDLEEFAQTLAARTVSRASEETLLVRDPDGHLVAFEVS